MTIQTHDVEDLAVVGTYDGAPTHPGELVHTRKGFDKLHVGLIISFKRHLLRSHKVIVLWATAPRHCTCTYDGGQLMCQRCWEKRGFYEP